MQGNVVEAGTTNFGVNIAGFMLHSAIHSARPDIKCIIHIHTPAIVAVSTRVQSNPLSFPKQKITHSHIVKSDLKYPSYRFQL